jgi:acetyl-CoA C-acetyltransferase
MSKKIKQVKIIGSYISDKFGELWDSSLSDLIEQAVFGVMENVFSKGKIDPNEIDAIYVANMASGLFSNQLHLNALTSQLFDHLPPSIRIEGACASGSLALIAAQDSLNSGRYETVMVLGVEKMTDSNSGEATKILSSASDYDFEYGSTFPALYALLAKAHMHKFGTTRKHLSAVSVKNHRHALNNSKAHFQKLFSLDQVSKSSMVADPLRLLDCSPVSDGASAVILSTKDFGKVLTDGSGGSAKRKVAGIAGSGTGKISYENKPKIIGFGHAQDSLDLANRETLTSLKATKKAVREALVKANESQENLTIKDIKVAEVHDCFTIAEILAIEDLGFFKKGEGAKATLEGKTTFGGDVVINPSGGLKACGHPVGATGVKQVAYLAELLEKGFSKNGDEVGGGNKEKIKIFPKYALAQNVGGSGATVVVHILEK